MNGDPAAFDAPFFSITAHGRLNAGNSGYSVHSIADARKQRQLRWIHNSDGFWRRLTEPWKMVIAADYHLENLLLMLCSWYSSRQGSRDKYSGLCFIHVRRLHYDDS